MVIVRKLHWCYQRNLQTAHYLIQTHLEMKLGVAPALNVGRFQLASGARQGMEKDLQPIAKRRRLGRLDPTWDNLKCLPIQHSRPLCKSVLLSSKKLQWSGGVPSPCYNLWDFHRICLDEYNFQHPYASDKAAPHDFAAHSNLLSKRRCK